MKNTLPLPENKKLSVIYSVESGCLGPEGARYIVDFCNYAQLELRSLDSDYIIWVVAPRDDKTLPEMQYSLIGKAINHFQAEKYLKVFDKNLDEFECHMSDRLEALIDQYMNRAIGSQ